MKTKEILKNIAADSELQRNVKSIGLTNDMILDNLNCYIKAIRDGRMCCVIDKVSKSGMSRTLKFMECNGNPKDGYRYYNFYTVFNMMGFTKVNNSDYFRVNGGGMDMVFDTNYRIIHRLHRLGFIDKKECDKLAQLTPSKL